MLLQMLTTHNLTSFILFFYVGVLVLGLLPFEVLLCDKQFKNALVDTILFASIFFASAFCYVQAWKAKVKSLTEQIYVLLSQLQASLEAKISLIQAQEGAWVNTLFKTISGLVLVIGVCLFAYWFFRGGGDDSESKDKGNPIDSISSKGSTVGSEAESNASAVGANIFDSTLTINDSVVDAVSHSVLTYLGLSVGHNDLSITQTKTFLVDFRASVTELKETLGTNLEVFRERTLVNKLDALKGIRGALKNVQSKINMLTVENVEEIRVNDLQREKLNNLAEELFKLLDSQFEFTLTSANEYEFPALCSVGLFFYMLTEGRNSISDLKSIFKSSIDEVRKLLNEYLAKENHPYSLKKEAVAVVKDFLKDFDCFFKSFDFWDHISKAGEDTSASKFFKRFEDLCQKIKV